MRLIIFALVVGFIAVAAGCTKPDVNPTASQPQNDGANADVQKVLHLRNVFLLSGTDPASPAPKQALYAVLINESGKPARLDRVTVDGGGTVQLAGPVELPPGRSVGTGEKPIGTVTGVRRDSVPMTFTFSGMAPVRLNVPVKSRTGPYANLNPGPAQPLSPAPTGGTQPAATPPAHGE
ncbi:hypothetical protein [Nonomuraea zeae]|uniref:Copper chaperone PCu(A)C n=1 Tax=Nonomuraea zeae TaxID=1642303 RepID=A0A5S4GBT0_9ACTN|nr:hypothetical protein [Nonomuraea zeae]TMR30423.1 hypothetical protein ETD85_29245 [Nonomuraea zeae]